MELDQRMMQPETGQVHAVKKAFSILECFTPTQPELSLAQLSRLCAMPKSTLLNQLRTMEAMGYVQRSRDGQTYRLGYSLMRLSYSLQSAMPLRYYAVPVMEELQVATGQTVYLTSHLQGRVFFLECVYPSRRSLAYSVSGKTLPMHCTSSGKAMLSRMTREQVSQILQIHGLPSVTPNTITDQARLMECLEQYRSWGYAVDDEEESIGIRCVAVPICTSSGMVAGALSISGSTMTMDQAAIEEYARLLSQTCGVLAAYAEQFPAIQTADAFGGQF